MVLHGVGVEGRFGTLVWPLYGSLPTSLSADSAFWPAKSDVVARFTMALLGKYWSLVRDHSIDDTLVTPRHLQLRSGHAVPTHHMCSRLQVTYPRADRQTALF